MDSGGGVHFYTAMGQSWSERNFLIGQKKEMRIQGYYIRKKRGKERGTETCGVICLGLGLNANLYTWDEILGGLAQSSFLYGSMRV